MLAEQDFAIAFFEHLLAHAAERRTTIERLLAYLPSELRAPTDQCRQALCALYEKGRVCWSGVFLSPAEFSRHIAACLVLRQADGGPSLRLDELPIDDLFLMWACATRNQTAMRIFYNKHLSLAVQKLPPTLINDIKHNLLVKLFADENPRYIEYTGSASLCGWLSHLARTEANRLYRQAPRPFLDECRPPTFTEVMAIEEGRGRILARQKLKTLVRAVLQLEKHSREQRAALRWYYIEEREITEIAWLLSLPYHTLRRWLLYADTELRKMATEVARQRLYLDTAQIGELVRTHLLISLVRE